MDIFHFGYLLFLYFTHNAFASTTTTPTAPASRPPPCPDLMCTLEFIPEDCREISLITINGVTCSGCPKWKPSCRDGPKSTAPVANNIPSVCPDLKCPKLDAPTECISVKTSVHNGVMCPECPVRLTNCPATTKQITRPQQQMVPGRLVAQLACPLFKCDADIPAECIVDQQYLTPSGRLCTRCPKWRKGCREQERIATNNGLEVLMDPTGKLNQRPDVPCPYFRCLSNTIPDECREEQPFEFNRKTCFRCPKWRAGCQGFSAVNSGQSRIPEIACPLMKCNLPDLPSKCFQDEMFQFQGKLCHKCPRVKNECQTIVPPRPRAVVDILKQTPVDRRLNEIACPLQACPRIYIPEECREFETFEFRGKTCKGCPRLKPGCVPLGTIPQAPAPTDTPQVPGIPDKESVVCPPLGCPFIYIPPECREQPTYDYQGITCKHCVRWREGCVAGTPGNNNPAPPCPVFQCVRIQIPEECVEVPTVYILGRNCTTCPRHREGCIPNGPNVDPGNHETMTTDTPIVPTGQGQQNDVACPPIPCTLLLIPDECREERPYNFQGKICYNCPIWREGCIPGQAGSVNQVEVTCPLVPCNRMFIPEECREERPYQFKGKTCYNCPVWRKGCVPGQSGQGKQNEVVCPLVACNKMLIPDECREERLYQFQGKTCYNCPVWREGCIPGQSAGGNQNEVACPLVACNKMLIPAECREERPYQFQGKTCYNCPVWREGCIPGQSVGGNQNEVACPVVPCTLMLIPDECREENPYQFQGKTCFNCPVWREGCVPGQSVGGQQNEVACPLVACIKMLIPAECREERPYQFQGKTCFNCPVWREGCVPGQSVGGNQNEVACPVVPCTLMLIPDECREERPYQFQGNTCFDCPVWREGCVPGQSVGGIQNEVACPLVACNKMLIPAECREERPYQFQGKTCYNCPVWREGCIPGQSAGGNQNEVACPLVACNKMLIPAECREERPYQFQGKTCYNCPVWREGCIPGQSVGGNQNEVACPVVPCTLMLIPDECREESPYQFQGKTCFNCPVWREGCVPGQSVGGQQNKVACPLVACNKMLIPAECREERPYQFQGKTCFNCPVWREGCVPGQSVGGNQNEVACPVVPCTLMLIPDECREERPYQFQGNTCFDCPVWREGCIPGQSAGGNQNQVACPVVACNYKLIPDECREEKPYKFQGKTCFNCPVWREGCIPGSKQPGIETLTNNEVTVTTSMPAINIACPLMKCNKMYIPPECREDTTYKFLGSKTCYKCPRWREGCVPGDKSQQVSSLNVNNQNTATQKTSTNQNTNNVNTDGNSENNQNTISGLRGVLPVDRFLQMINQIECPPLPCPAVYIPPRCVETVPYIYQGKLCRGCPTWRYGCSATDGQWQNSNFDGLLAYNLFRELAGFGA